MGLSKPRPACVSHPCPRGLFLGAEVPDGERTRQETQSSSCGRRGLPWSPPGACTLPTPGRAPGGHALGDSQQRLQHLPSWWEAPALGGYNSTGAMPPCPAGSVGEGPACPLVPWTCPAVCTADPARPLCPPETRRCPRRQTLLPRQTRLSVFCRSPHVRVRKEQTRQPGLLPRWLDSPSLCDCARPLQGRPWVTLYHSQRDKGGRLVSQNSPAWDGSISESEAGFNKCGAETCVLGAWEGPPVSWCRGH